MVDLATASWWALWTASKAGPLPVQPVRTSRGKPRYWPAAAGFPAVEELMPDGYMFGIKDPERFGHAYRRKLHTIGLPAIQARLDAIAQQCGLPLALACFERDRADCHRGQIAAWYERKTGVLVPELSLAELSEPGHTIHPSREAGRVVQNDRPADPPEAAR